MSAATHVLSISDWLALPELRVPTLRDATETGVVMMVVKGGFLLATEAECETARISAEPGLNGKFVLPTAMIQDAKAPRLHRLPTGFASWVLEAVALARAGRNLFPSKVEFGKLNGRIYAEYDLSR
jgi:hypothetical protein